MNDETIAFLEANSDKKFKEFTSALTPTGDKIYGVRVPVLRAYAKKSAEGDVDDFLKADKNSLEEKMLAGFIIGYADSPFDVFTRRVENFALEIDNWAVCDTACATFKIIKKRREEFLPTLDKLLGRGGFSKRLAIVALLNYYAEEKYAGKIFSVCDGVRNDGYYVKSAAAWLLAECYVKMKDRTENYFEAGRPDEFTLKKAIEKISDSRRVSEQDKIRLKKLKGGRL